MSNGTENKNDKRCLGCTEVLSNETAKEHYRLNHPVLYTLSYDKQAFLDMMKDRDNVTVAASFAQCGKCKRDTPPCERCAPMFAKIDALSGLEQQ